MRATEHFGKINVAAGTFSVIPDGNGADYLFGGEYQFNGIGTGAGTVDLQYLGADGATWEPAITQLTTTVYNQTVKLPPGRYRVVIAGFTANNFNLTRVPTAE